MGNPKQWMPPYLVVYSATQTDLEVYSTTPKFWLKIGNYTSVVNLVASCHKTILVVYSATPGLHSNPQIQIERYWDTQTMK